MLSVNGWLSLSIILLSSGIGFLAGSVFRKDSQKEKISPMLRGQGNSKENKDPRCTSSQGVSLSESSNIIPLDLTLEPPDDWIDDTLCGVSFRKHPNFKQIFRQVPQVEGSKCSFGFNYNEVPPEQIFPIVLKVDVDSNYDGSAALGYYFQERERANSTHVYQTATEFKAGSNTGLALTWKDVDTGDGGIGDYRVYLIVRPPTTLISVTSENETVVLRMFLTGMR